MESYGIMVFREYMTCTTVPGKKQTTAPGTAWPSNLTPASVQIGEYILDTCMFPGHTNTSSHTPALIPNSIRLLTAPIPPSHRRRKILKVGGAKDMIAREKLQTTPTLGQTAPIFERLTLLRLDFLHKRTNGKSSRADLAAT